MVKAQKKKKKIKFNIFHFLIVFVFIYVVAIFWQQNSLLNDLEAKKEIHSLEVKQIQKDIADLEKEIKSSQSLKFVEKVARDELGMVKPREIIYIDKDKKESSVFKEKNKDK